MSSFDENKFEEQTYTKTNLTPCCACVDLTQCVTAVYTLGIRIRKGNPFDDSFPLQGRGGVSCSPTHPLHLSMAYFDLPVSIFDLTFLGSKALVSQCGMAKKGMFLILYLSSLVT